VLLMPTWPTSRPARLTRGGRLGPPIEEEPLTLLSSVQSWHWRWMMTKGGGGGWPGPPEPNELKGDAVLPKDAPTQGTIFLLSCGYR
jgi:hypothetical protein